MAEGDWSGTLRLTFDGYSIHITPSLVMVWAHRNEHVQDLVDSYDLPKDLGRSILFPSPKTPATPSDSSTS